MRSEELITQQRQMQRLSAMRARRTGSSALSTLLMNFAEIGVLMIVVV